MLSKIYNQHSCLTEFKIPKNFKQVYEQILEKEMATHSSILACRIPGAEEPG